MKRRRILDFILYATAFVAEIVLFAMFLFVAIDPPGATSFPWYFGAFLLSFPIAAVPCAFLWARIISAVVSKANGYPAVKNSLVITETQVKRVVLIASIIMGIITLAVIAAMIYLNIYEALSVVRLVEYYVYVIPVAVGIFALTIYAIIIRELYIAPKQAK